MTMNYLIELKNVKVLLWKQTSFVSFDSVKLLRFAKTNMSELSQPIFQSLLLILPINKSYYKIALPKFMKCLFTPHL